MSIHIIQKEYFFRHCTYRMGIEKEEGIPKILHNIFDRKGQIGFISVWLEYENVFDLIGSSYSLRHNV
jgi:hypothetical protein